jgi:hypothetical protein
MGCVCIMSGVCYILSVPEGELSYFMHTHTHNTHAHARTHAHTHTNTHTYIRTIIQLCFISVSLHALCTARRVVQFGVRSKVRARKAVCVCQYFHAL